METPPSYQEATAKKKNWFKRIVGKLFGRTPPQAGLLVERKLIHPFRTDFDLYPSSSQRGKLLPRTPSQAGSALGPVSAGALSGYRNSIHHTPDQPPTNYVRIKRNNAPIIGIWNIDTALHVPEHLLVPFKDKSEARHHLHLWSAGQTIDALINIVEGEKKGEGVVLLTASSLGNVTLRVTKPSQRTLSIFVRGSLIKVFIPRTYQGTLKAHTATGSVFFSNEVAKRLRTVYEKGRESRHFIGDMDNVVGEGDAKEEEEGKYDVMKLKAKSRVGEKYGEVYIAYEDEEEVFLA